MRQSRKEIERENEKKKENKSVKSHPGLNQISSTLVYWVFNFCTRFRARYNCLVEL